MKTETKKFLEFNGKNIYFVAVDGQYWIALKPICEALNVSWKYQHDKLIKHKMLGQLSRNIGMVAADEKIRKMVSLPEFYVYGWIFKLDSVTENNQDYQWECYAVLYNYFHGTITGRKELLSLKAQAQLVMNEVMNSLNPELALKYAKARSRLNQITAQLRDLDGEILQEERDLFSS